LSTAELNNGSKIKSYLSELEKEKEKKQKQRDKEVRRVEAKRPRLNVNRTAVMKILI